MSVATNRTTRILASVGLALVIGGGFLVPPATASAAGPVALQALPATAARTRILTQPTKVTISRYGTRTKGAFKVVATGSKLSYRWQYRSAGVWKSIPGATSRTYKAKATKWSSGTRFRVVVSGANGKATSRTARLKVLQPTRTPAKDAEKAFGLSGLRQGLDLSAWQYLPGARINMSKVADRLGSKGFTILRNGSGSRPINEDFVDACTNQARNTGSTPVLQDCAYPTLASQAKAAGLSLGHYWFNGWIISNDNTKKKLFSGGFTAKRSAATYVKWLKADGKYTRKSTDPLVLDIEDGNTWVKKSNGKTYQRTLKAWSPGAAKVFLTEVKRLLTKDGYHANLYVYMGANAASRQVDGQYVWAEVAPIARLWVASWGTDNGRIPAVQPKVGPWVNEGGWSIWQYTANARIAGDGVGALDGDIAKSDAWKPRS